MSNESIDLRDQLSIETPELVGIEFPLAGIGSRCVALLVDSCVQGFSLMVILIVSLLLLPRLPRTSTVQHRRIEQYGKVGDRTDDPGSFSSSVGVLRTL